MNGKFFVIALILLVAGAIYYFGFGQKKSELPEKETQLTDQNTPEEKTQPTSQGPLEIMVLKEGAGAEAKSGDTIAVHYVGTLEDGTKFDSSYDRGTPFVFILGIGQVIKGWDQGVLAMKVGEKRKLIIASELAYGERGAPGAIPPNATLIFEVELLEIR